MKLAKLVLQTARYNELKKFYGEILGLPFDEIKDDCFVIHIHDSKLIFTNAVPLTNPLYHFAFNIPSNKIDEAIH
jgi:catechol-2,3-dioxygenase